MKSPAIERLGFVLLGLLIALLLAPTRCPLTTDSDAYLDVARNLREGEGLSQRIVDFWRPAVPDPLGLWPPGYPLSIAVVAATGLDLETAARAVSLVSFLVFVWAFHALARHVASPGAARLACLLALTTSGVHRVATAAWSEALFMALATCGLWGVAKLSSGAAETGTEARVAWWSGAMTGFAAVTRYVGLLPAALGTASLVLMRARPAVIAAWCVPALLPPALWAIRNLVVFGRPDGPGLAPSDRTLAEIARTAFAGLHWGLVPVVIAIVPGLSALLLGAIGVGLLRSLRGRPSQRLIAAYVLLYLLSLVGLRGAANFNDIGERYLTPILPFLWLGGLAGLAPLLSSRAIASKIGVAACWLLLVAAALDPWFDWRDAERPSPECSARAAETAELARLLHGRQGLVLSEAGHRVRDSTRLSAVQVPGPRFRVRAFTAEDEARWRRAGVRTAVFRRESSAESRARHGEHLALRRFGSAPGRWAAVDSTSRFVLYELR